MSTAKGRGKTVVDSTPLPVADLHEHSEPTGVPK